jgi:hypothetical protein
VLRKKVQHNRITRITEEAVIQFIDLILDQPLHIEVVHHHPMVIEVTGKDDVCFVRVAMHIPTEPLMKGETMAHFPSKLL